MHVINAKTGKVEAQWEWRKTPKEGPRSLKFLNDESYCMRLVPQAGNAKDPNSIEVYANGNFSAPKMVIQARFPVKPAKKSDAVTFVNGRFDGLDLCPLNPAVPAEQSPFYMMAWQNANIMTEDEENGTVYFYDLKTNFERSKFMITCPRGQEIQTLVDSKGHAALLWSQNPQDKTGKSYYGEHML